MGSKKTTLLACSKNLRTNQTDTEKLLWYRLRANRFLGLTFRRQHIISGYIVDFVCVSKKIIIELDGGQHIMQADYDKNRTAILSSLGYKVLRFWNHEVLQNLSQVLDSINQVINNAPSPLRVSPPQSGGDIRRIVSLL